MTSLTFDLTSDQGKVSRNRKKNVHTCPHTIVTPSGHLPYSEFLPNIILLVGYNIQDLRDIMRFPTISI